MFFSSDNFIEREQRKLFITRLLRRIFLEDWLVKLIALFISVALWLGVTGLREPISTTLKANLNINYSKNFEVTNSPPKEITIFVTGDKRKVDPLRDSEMVSVSIDLTDAKQGDRLVQLTPDNVSVQLPSGVKLDEIQPNKILVKLERVEERDVPVIAETEGRIADGFEIYEQTVTPAKARVRGAESFVNSLNSLMTEKINLDGHNADFTARQIELNVINPNITVLDGIVDVNFKIGEKRSERIFVVPVKAERETRKATAVLYGARSILENLRAEDLKIELTKAENGELTPQLILPAEIQNKIEIRQLKLTK